MLDQIAMVTRSEKQASIPEKPADFFRMSYEPVFYLIFGIGFCGLLLPFAMAFFGTLVQDLLFLVLISGIFIAVSGLLVFGIIQLAIMGRSLATAPIDHLPPASGTNMKPVGSPKPADERVPAPTEELVTPAPILGDPKDSEPDPGSRDSGTPGSIIHLSEREWMILIPYTVMVVFLSTIVPALFMLLILLFFVFTLIGICLGWIPITGEAGKVGRAAGKARVRLPRSWCARIHSSCGPGKTLILMMYLGTFMAILGIMGASAEFRFFPVGLGTDGVILFFGSLLLFGLTKSCTSVESTPGRICFRWEAMIRRDELHLSRSDVSCVAIQGKLAGIPVLLNWFSSSFCVVLVTKGGEILPLTEFLRSPKETLSGTLARAEKFGRWFAAQKGIPFLENRTRTEGTPCEILSDVFRADFHGTTPERGPQILENLRSSTDLFDSPQPGSVRLEVSTPLEKACLGLIASFFLVSTVLLLYSQNKLIMDNPRILYLVMLDSGSFLATLFWLWKKLLDQHFELDLRSGSVNFLSRILFWRSIRRIASFEHVAGARIITEQWEPLSLVPEPWLSLLPDSWKWNHKVVLVLCDGREVTVSETVHGDREIPRIWERALSKIIRKESPDDPESLFAPSPTI